MAIIAAINGVLWHDSVLYFLLFTGVVFTLWSRFSQRQSLTHGFRVVSGRYNDAGDPGVLSHFQALSAALSNTVGLGNIGGVALAISLGGPGAVFWMWVVGLLGMAIKSAEVNLSMLYRNTDDPDNPHGGPMWVIYRGTRGRGPLVGAVGRVMGALFCCSLLVAITTGGNMFQAWNVSNMTRSYFGVPTLLSGLVMTALIAVVIVGGIRRIGAVAGRLVPMMVGFYLLAGTWVLWVNRGELLDMLALIFTSAFSPREATGAFIGGTVGNAFLFGMKRAIFSSEVGQGTSPMAHCAVKTDEPIREGIVAGLEPLVDTLFVCTFTALIILSTGVWNRSGDAQLPAAPVFEQVASSTWQAGAVDAPPRDEAWVEGDPVYVVVRAHDNLRSGNRLHKLSGTVTLEDGRWRIHWQSFDSPAAPELADTSIYLNHVGAVLTARAFDAVLPGLGKYLVTLAVWMFALSTMLGASYYGEQAIVYLFGEAWVKPYKAVFCGLTLVSCVGFIESDLQLDALTGLGAGCMVLANVPILWLFSGQVMRAYRDYLRRMGL